MSRRDEIIEKAITWMEQAALNPAHGYDQRYRWGEYGDYDCSSAVITAWRSAGLPLKCTYTGDMKKDMLRNGFKDVTAKVNRSNASGMQRGDVLLNEVRHVAMYCGGNTEVEASINENGGAVGGKPGDQTSREFLIRPYRNFPWDCILRFEGSGGVVKPTEPEKESDGVSARPKWIGRVTATLLNVRTWAGTEYPNIQSYPTLPYGTLVEVCDSIKASTGNTWYFVRIAGEYYGFVSAFYIERAEE